MAKSARQMLLEEAQKFLERKTLLESIAAQATPIQGGYFVPTELIEKVKQKVAERNQPSS